MKTERTHIETPSYFWDGKTKDYKDKAPESLAEYYGPRNAADQALHFLDSTRSRVNAVNDVIKKNLANPVNTPAGAKMLNRKIGKKTLTDIQEQSNSVISELRTQIQAIDKKVNREITGEASARDAAEIRSHIKNLPEEKRVTFIQQRINAEDWATVSAAIGKRHFLAGIDKKSKDLLLEGYKEKRFADQIKVKNHLHKIYKNLWHGHQRLEENFNVLDDQEAIRAEQLNEQAQQAIKNL